MEIVQAKSEPWWRRAEGTALQTIEWPIVAFTVGFTFAVLCVVWPMARVCSACYARYKTVSSVD